jgi:integrase
MLAWRPALTASIHGRWLKETMFMKAKISKSQVDQTVATTKPVIVFDTALSGFVLKVTPAGKKTFQLRYRLGGRNTPLRTYTIGTFGPITADQARKSAEMLIGDVRRGIDPAGEKAKRAIEASGGTTIAAISADFMRVHVETKRKERTAIEYGKLMESAILPKLGRKNVKDILVGDIEVWHHDLRATPYLANRALAVLSKMLNWAASRGFRSDDNPCRSVEKFKETARKRYLAPAEIGAVGGAIRQLEANNELSPHVAALFRILLLTGMRKDEVRLLQWSRVNLERSVFILKDIDAKNGERDVPISAPVRQILATLPRFDGNPYVFVGKLSGQPVVNLAKSWKRVLASAGIAPTRIHDLRHTVGSVGVASGASIALIGGVLGHKSPQTTARYAHLSDDPVRATSETIAERVASALDSALRPPGELVKLPAKRDSTLE